MFTVTTHCAFMSTECVCVYACSVQVHFLAIPVHVFVLLVGKMLVGRV